MILHVPFIYFFSIVSANSFYDMLDSYSYDKSQVTLVRKSRAVSSKKDYQEFVPTCALMTHNTLSPFVVLLLYRTSGNFLGMGSILDEKTILSAALVVEHSMQSPGDLLVLAGRLGPWWGKGSQVKRAQDIYVHTTGLALIVLKNELKFSDHVRPITLPPSEVQDFKNYGKFFAIFGLTRSSWDVPGEPTPKTNMYLMKIENVLEKEDDCKKAYPDLEFNTTTMVCTIANGSFSWGCLGSPTLAVDKKERVQTIAVVIKTTFTEKDDFHVHLKIQYYEPWIRSHTPFKQIA